MRHGGDLGAFSERFGKREEEILDFSSNVNPLGLSETLLRLYPELVREITRYPDPSVHELRREIARHFPLWPQNVIAGNGAMALLALAIRFLAPRRALLVEPCFTEYRRLLNLQGAQIRSVLLREGTGFEFTLAEIANSLRGMDLLIIGHPNNPTGTALSREALMEVLQEARRCQVFVVVDEAFADWAPEISIAREVKDNASFLVIRSLTKFFALAGIRAGFALGSRKCIERLAAFQETWSCNRLAQKLSIAALRDEAFRTKSLDWFREESVWFKESLESLGIFKVYASLANFFLMKIKPVLEGPPLWQALGEKGIYVRTLEDFAGLDESYLRVALRARKENQVLLETLRNLRAGVPVPP